ncbi:hypothetical protein PR048_014347 [Dryococelus australis]|uniref:Uncharacterized protein n=1 Tax=Dryococelus australis TaxID=614101 RepID=A0ABQ9HE05_9NEOP|nr:hypothetical protein PR048_014347 [Dryococelus australis]
MLQMGHKDAALELKLEARTVHGRSAEKVVIRRPSPQGGCPEAAAQFANGSCGLWGLDDVAQGVEGVGADGVSESNMSQGLAEVARPESLMRACLRVTPDLASFLCSSSGGACAVASGRSRVQSRSSARDVRCFGSGYLKDWIASQGYERRNTENRGSLKAIFSSQARVTGHVSSSPAVAYGLLLHLFKDSSISRQAFIYPTEADNAARRAKRERERDIESEGESGKRAPSSADLFTTVVIQNAWCERGYAGSGTNKRTDHRGRYAPPGRWSRPWRVAGYQGFAACGLPPPTPRRSRVFLIVFFRVAAAALFTLCSGPAGGWTAWIKVDSLPTQLVNTCRVSIVLFGDGASVLGIAFCDLLYAVKRQDENTARRARRSYEALGVRLHSPLNHHHTGRWVACPTARSRLKPSIVADNSEMSYTSEIITITGGELHKNCEIMVSIRCDVRERTKGFQAVQGARRNSAMATLVVANTGDMRAACVIPVVRSVSPAAQVSTPKECSRRDEPEQTRLINSEIVSERRNREMGASTRVTLEGSGSRASEKLEVTANRIQNTSWSSAGRRGASLSDDCRGLIRLQLTQLQRDVSSSGRTHLRTASRPPRRVPSPARPVTRVARPGLAEPAEWSPNSATRHLSWRGETNCAASNYRDITLIQLYCFHRGRGGLAARQLISLAGKPDSIPGGGIFASRNRDGSAGFLGDLPFFSSLHSGAAPYSTQFSPIGSQALDVKSLPYLFTSSLAEFSCKQAIREINAWAVVVGNKTASGRTESFSNAVSETPAHREVTKSVAEAIPRNWQLVTEKKRAGRFSVSTETSAAFQEAFLYSPEKSMRRECREWQIPRTTLHQMLQKRLRFHAYRLRTVQTLFPNYRTIRVHFASESHTVDKNLRHNCRIRGSVNGGTCVEYKRDSPQINAWCALSKARVVKPFFFQGTTIQATKYLDMAELYTILHTRVLPARWSTATLASCKCDGSSMKSSLIVGLGVTDPFHGPPSISRYYVTRLLSMGYCKGSEGDRCPENGIFHHTRHAAQRMERNCLNPGELVFATLIGSNGQRKPNDFKHNAPNVYSMINGTKWSGAICRATPILRCHPTAMLDASDLELDLTPITLTSHTRRASGVRWLVERLSSRHEGDQTTDYVLTAACAVLTSVHVVLIAIRAMLTAMRAEQTSLREELNAVHERNPVLVTETIGPALRTRVCQASVKAEPPPPLLLHRHIFNEDRLLPDLKQTIRRVVVAEWLSCVPPTKAYRAQFPAGTLLDLRMWKSCRKMPLVGGFTRRSPVPPALSSRRCSIFT